ncbi:efflux RND transporter periplasmic adaptor subunit [Denitratisoma sp. agr-D3]
MNPRQKRLVVTTLAGLLLAWGGIAVIQARANNAPVAPAPSGPTVEVAEVINRAIVDWKEFSGRLETPDRADIRAQVSGVLTAVHFKDGALVKKGDPLFTIDPRPYAAEVSAAEARADYAASEFARAERLLAENAIAKRDFEEKKNAAQVAQAALRIAKLNLEYTRITAPFDGRVSRAEITVGNLITANSGPALTTLVSSGRIYAGFDVDEQTFLKYVNPARSAKGVSLPVHLGLANEDGYSRQGGIQSVDNHLDNRSGTIRVRAVFDNPDGQLVPGLYARIRLGGSQERNTILIDGKAVGTDQDKRFVLVVGADNKTAYREIHLGASQDGLQIVDSGLKAGERIVVNGLQRVHPGDTIVPQTVAMAGNKNAATSADANAKDGAATK